MRLSQLKPGDLILVNKDGIPFEARVVDVLPSSVRFQPLEKWATWRWASARQIVRRVDPPQSKRRRRRQEAEPKVSDEDRAQLELYPSTARSAVQPPEKSAAAPG